MISETLMGRDLEGTDCSRVFFYSILGRVEHRHLAFVGKGTHPLLWVGPWATYSSPTGLRCGHTWPAATEVSHENPN